MPFAGLAEFTGAIVGLAATSLAIGEGLTSGVSESPERPRPIELTRQHVLHILRRTRPIAPGKRYRLDQERYPFNRRSEVNVASLVAVENVPQEFFRAAYDRSRSGTLFCSFMLLANSLVRLRGWALPT
jgi:hypothetical protein